MSWSWRLLLILPLLALLNPAAGREQELDRVRFYTQWNDDYLFVAAKCEDVNVVGRRSGLNQPVWLDDDFEVFLHHGKEKPEKINDQSYWISVSAAGGFSFQRGDPGGTWLPASPLVAGAPSPKLEVRVHGSLNDPADADLGWELELGIPWAALGQTKPAPNEVWGFNVVRHLRGDQDARFSYVPQATPIAAQTAPARWGFIVFRGNQGESAWIGPGEQNVVISERAAGSFEVAGRPVPRPLVDGVIQIGEWPDLYRIDAELRPEYLLDVPHEAFAANEAPGEVPAGCSFQTRPVPTRTARGVYLGERLILATYRLDYHDDARDPQRPAFGVRDATGASLLAAQPLRGLGPWFSGL
ncbi:MAG: carbohydrate-binding family 9-like protein, partial [Armatimonadetes bacterium]|nr:carbohydrate-binding family 9-like protein [Armatimonadota bacterium]